MRFEVGTEPGKERKMITIFPSEEHGVFTIDHLDFGMRAVGSLGLAGMDEDTVTKIEEGELSLHEQFIEGDDGTIMPRSEKVVLAADVLAGDPRIAGQTEWVFAEGFREMSQVPLAEM